MADVFDKVAKAEITGREPNLDFGDYLLSVKSLRFQQGHKGDSFVFVFDVVEAKPVHPDYRPTPEGWTVGQAYNISNPSSAKYAMSDVKKFAAALLRKRPEQIEAPMLRQMVDPMHADDVAGAQVRCKIMPSDKLGTDGTPFKNIRWSQAE